MQSVLKGIGAEYSDEVTKCNKKEDMMLGKKIRVLDRQERIAHSFRQKNLWEVEKLKHSIHDMTNRSIDLKQYDLRRMSEKFGRHSNSDVESSRHRNLKNVRETKFNFRLPPLENNFMTGSPRGQGYSKNTSNKTSGYSTRDPAGRRNKGVVTINGVQFDYGSREHYKAYQKARKFRNETLTSETNLRNVEKGKDSDENQEEEIGEVAIPDDVSLKQLSHFTDNT